MLLQLFTHTGRNRARQHDAADVFTAIDRLMVSAEATNDDVLARYTLHHVLHCLHAWFETGFELALFASHELPYVYWWVVERKRIALRYMSDVVYRWLRNLVGQAVETSLNNIRMR